MTRPLCIDLFTGLHGWADGAIAAGFRVVGYDIVDMSAEVGEPKPEHFDLVLQDVATIDGAALSDAALILASPPCPEFSYMAMPWRRAKQIARALRGQDDFPEGYTGSRTIAELTALFDACFRIQREASAAAGRNIPMVVENVRGAEPWVGRAKWNFGSYYLWGDVPALMPHTLRAQKFNPDGTSHGQGSWFAVADSKDRGSKNTGGSWFNIAHNTTSGVGNNPDGRKNPGFRFDGAGKSFQSESVNRHVAPAEGYKSRGMDWSNRELRGQDFTAIAGAQAAVAEGVKVPSTAGRSPAPGSGARLTSIEPAEARKGAGAGAEWFDQNLCSLPSKSPRRKAASAKIAKIPFALAHWIARTYCPQGGSAVGKPKAGCSF